MANVGLRAPDAGCRIDGLVLADAAKVEQIVLDLVSNAVSSRRQAERSPWSAKRSSTVNVGSEFKLTLPAAADRG